jgi:sodium-dependent dicarboxylate transporter 2/3/5
VILPYLEHIATKTSWHFMILAVPLVIGASCAFMLPIATPPNAIVFASGKLTVSDMIKAGWKINAIAFIIISLASYFIIEKLGILIF